MANKNKEAAVNEYIEMIKGSWTWDRLSTYERDAFLKSIQWATEQGAMIGNYKQRWMICEAMYEAFLNALCFAPTGWRGE